MKRREFLKCSAGLLGIGFISPSLLTSSKEIDSTSIEAYSLNGYQFDLEEVKVNAYHNYYQYECMGGVAGTLINILARDIGEPFASFPIYMFKYGGAGINNWGTICGSLNGGSAFLSLIYPAEVHKPMIDNLFNWYCHNPFPFKDLDNIAKFQNQTQVEPEYPLCHVSVARWTVKNFRSGYPAFVNTPERADRCGKVTAEVAWKVATMVNEYEKNKYLDYAEYSPLFKTKMNCEFCHD